MNNLLDHAASAFSTWSGILIAVVVVAYFIGCAAIVGEALWDKVLVWLINKIEPGQLASRFAVIATTCVVVCAVAFGFMFVLPILALIAFFVKLCERLWGFVNNG